MKINKIKNNNGGYAILFTVVIVGIISMITIGLSNSAYKQTILSSVARDSTAAFYQADIGSECALYVDREYQDQGMKVPDGWKCAGNTLSFSEPDISIPNTTIYKLILSNENSSAKCFRINIKKTASETASSTEITTTGYNICNKSNFRTVERGIRVTY
jgi:hypothetical protein